MELLGQRVWTFLRLLIYIGKLPSRKVEPIYTPISNVWECPLPHLHPHQHLGIIILFNICHFYSKKWCLFYLHLFNRKGLLFFISIVCIFNHFMSFVFLLECLPFSYWLLRLFIDSWNCFEWSLLCLLIATVFMCVISKLFFCRKILI